MITEILDKIKYDVLRELIARNKEYIEMKITSGIDDNFIFGRTLSLGQWLGYYLGRKLARELPEYTILVDSCLSTLQKYPCKGNNKKLRARQSYPDILVLQKAAVEIKNLKEDEVEIAKNYNKTIKKYGLYENIDESTFHIFKALASIELKMDPGYIGVEDLQKSFKTTNEYIKNKERFSYEKLVRISENVLDKNRFFNLKNIIHYDDKMEKVLVLATEANHSERIQDIKLACEANNVIYKSFTGKKKHIRDFSGEDLDSLKDNF